MSSRRGSLLAILTRGEIESTLTGEDDPLLVIDFIHQSEMLIAFFLRWGVTFRCFRCRLAYHLHLARKPEAFGRFQFRIRFQSIISLSAKREWYHNETSDFQGRSSSEIRNYLGDIENRFPEISVTANRGDILAIVNGLNFGLVGIWNDLGRNQNGSNWRR